MHTLGTGRRRQAKAQGPAILTSILTTLPATMPAILLAGVLALTGCTKEQQNRLGRGIQNWTGTDGVLDVYAGEKLVIRFIKIDKMTTGIGTSDNQPRSYRYGYGVVDENLNFLKDPGEKRVYFEVSDYSTSYVFYENYKD